MEPPPGFISEFYEYIKNADYDSIEKLPNFFTSQTALYAHRDIESLISHDAGPRWKSASKEQAACFDFTGRCAMWPNCPRMLDTDRHTHPRAAWRGFGVNNFPGLYFLPQMIEYRQTQLKLIDTILHDELASPTGLTNLDASYHRSYPFARNNRRSSYFDPEASAVCKFRPRDSSAPTDYALTLREFVENLRWLKFGKCPEIEHSSALPAPFKKLVDSIFKLPVDVHAATAFLSSSDGTIDLRQHGEESEHFIHLYLGCDAIVVISNAGHRKDGNDENKEQDDKSLIAIHVQQGDALVFTGESRSAWCGVAKVLGGNDSWETDWPCTQNYEIGTNGGRWMWKGCMKGRMIDLVAW